jgi:hypothetical protein
MTMSDNDIELDALEAFTETLENITLSLYAQDKQTNMKAVAIGVLSTLRDFGWELVKSDGQSTNGIEEAKEALARSKRDHVRTGAQSAVAYALQGILAILIEQQQNSGLDAPFLGDLDSPFKGPDEKLWGGEGARG